MKESTLANEDELMKKAIEILFDHLGPVETSRFLSISQEKRMESVQRHRKWQDNLDKDDFFDSLFNQDI